MRRECQDCRTVTGGAARYCGACGYRFRANQDPVRSMAKRGRRELGMAALMGVAAAVLQFYLFH